jgi:hypothetical protein
MLLSVLLVFGPQASPASEACGVEQVRLSWGFTESLRNSLSGARALGNWTTDGDVGYETPEFIFTGGEGSLAPDRSTGEVSFEGELRWRAYGGIVETALVNPQLRLVGKREALLVFDVVGGTIGGLQVEQKGVEFVSLTWPASAETLDATAGIWRVDKARVVLTPLGAGAFSRYLSGEVFDPLSFSIQVQPQCLSDGGFRWWWVPGGALVLAVVGAFVWACFTRAKKSREPEHQ